MGNVKKFRFKNFKALSVTCRLEILEFLRDEEKRVGDIAQYFGIRQFLVSRHPKILREGGLMNQGREGTRRLYSVTDPRIFELIDLVTLDLVNAPSKRAINKMTV